MDWNPLQSIDHNWRKEFYIELSNNKPERDLEEDKVLNNVPERVHKCARKKWKSTIHTRTITETPLDAKNPLVAGVGRDALLKRTIKYHVHVKASDKFIVLWTMHDNRCTGVQVEGIRASTAAARIQHRENKTKQRPIVHLCSQSKVRSDDNDVDQTK